MKSLVIKGVESGFNQYELYKKKKKRWKRSKKKLKERKRNNGKE
jgi:hypothetical protein